MTRLSLIEKSKLNLQDVTVLIKGGGRLEVDMLAQIFASFGTRHVRKAETLDEARDTLDNETIDLLVLDVTAGLYESLQLVSGMRRAAAESRYAPVVLTTASAVPSLLNAALDAGVSYIVTKPLAPRVLFERLLWIVKDARPFVEAASYVGPDRRTRLLGPPAGRAGRRAGDLPPEVGDASTPNLSQTDIDSLFPVRRVG